MNHHGTAAHINLYALRHNLQQVNNFAPHCKTLAMIKSNAYGHGITEIAACLSDADAFGVACISEALMLRKTNIKNRIVIMRGFANIEELTAIAEHGFDAVIHHKTQLEILQNSHLKNKISVWLKIDTGMHRLGFLEQEAVAAYKALKASNNIKQLQIMTHFAEADTLTKKTTQQQITTFNSITNGFSEPKSMANSAAIMAWPETHLDWVRPGIMLYGASPFADKTGHELGLKPVMTLKSTLIAVKFLPKGAKIGYGSTWQCSEDMPLGIAAIGYGDGYPRHATNGTPILVDGIKCQLAGRVSMDMLAIDLRNRPDAKCGAEVTLWGDNLPAEHIAKTASTIPYELFCGITKRVKFNY